MSAVTLQCVADTYVSSATPDQNYGAATTLEYLTAGGAVTTSKFIYFKFQGVDIANRKITGAKIRFYRADTGSASNAYLTPLNAIFSEATTTYQNQPSASTSSALIMMPTDIGWYEVQIPAGQLASIVNAVQNNGIRMSGANSQNTAQLYSRESSYPPTFTVEYEATPPLKPTLVEPLSGSFDRGIAVRFAWTYVPGYTDTQAGFTLQYKLSSASDWIAIEQMTGNQYYIMPAGTLPVGDIAWRVKTQNQFGEESPWSDEASISVYGVPDAPTVTVSGGARPVIAWTSDDRNAWELRIERADGAAIYQAGANEDGRLQAHEVRKYLADAQYTARVRVMSAYGFWSLWGEKAFTVSTAKPTPPEIISASTQADGIIITCSYSTPTCILYRRKGAEPFEILTELSGGTVYADYGVASGQAYEYFARAVKEDNAFSDSQPITLSTQFAYATIASAIAPERRILLRLRSTQTPNRAWTMTPDITLQAVMGRVYPVAEDSGRRSESITIEFYAKLDLLESIKSMMDIGAVLYRGPDGRTMRGAITSIADRASAGGYDVQITIYRTSPQEDAEYA